MKKLIVVFVLLLVGSLLFVNPLYMQEPDGKPDRPTPTPSVPEDVFTPQIVGGTLATVGEFPWQVALMYATNPNPYLGQFCGGSLIDPEWVLTAAHCVFDTGGIMTPGEIDVVVGIIKLSSGPTTGSTGQRLDVAQIIPHPNYNEITVDSDLALLRLSTPATLDSTVGVIGLVEPGNANLANPGVNATISGWGDTTGNDDYPDDLFKVSVPIVSNATCNAPASYNGDITDNMFCAGLAAGGKDSCQGDSGGPLVVPNGGGWLQAGIVSWGIGCAQPNLYGVYTRVWNFKSWIDSQTGSGFVPTDFIYLPMIIKSGASTTVCTPSPAGDSDNVNDALTVCSGQTVTGQVSDSDLDDVYKITVVANQTLTLSLSGTGVGGTGDADLYLYPPGTTDVFTDAPFEVSDSAGNSESMSEVLPQGGVWYIDIYDAVDGDGGTNYSLTITLSN